MVHGVYSIVHLMKGWELKLELKLTFSNPDTMHTQ